MSRKNTYSGVRGGKGKKQLGAEYRSRNREKLAEKGKLRYRKNKEKINALARANYRENKDQILKRQRTRQLKRLYGLTEDDVCRMVAEQGNVCDLCRLPIEPKSGPNTVVDHDHKTGRIRGILHKLCNLGIGAFGDDIKRIRQAEKYLQKHILKELSELGQEQEQAEAMRETNGERLLFDDHTGRWTWRTV